jgi:hypothetical protein
MSDMNENEAKAIRDLCAAAAMAHRWVAKMKIVPGGERERLRDTLNETLARVEPVRIIAEGILSSGKGRDVDSDCG